MPEAVQKQIQSEQNCDDLLTCMLGLNQLDKDVFRLLVESDEPLTVDHIADFIDRERTTAYRSVKRLQEAGIVEKDQESCQHGGYHHVYRVKDADVIADGFQQMLNNWYANTGQLIQEFRDTYGEIQPPKVGL